MPMPEKSPSWGYKFVRFKEEKNKITGEKQIKSKQVPTDVLKQMLKDGVITKVQYNKWH